MVPIQQNQTFFFHTELSLRPAIAAIIIVAEAVLLLLVYRYDFIGLLPRPAEKSLCLQVIDAAFICKSLSKGPQIVVLLAGICGLGLLLSPNQKKTASISAQCSRSTQPNYLLSVNIAGFVFVLVPYFMVLVGLPPEIISVLGLAFWLLGSVFLVGGLSLWLLPVSQISRLLSWKVAAGILFIACLPHLDRLVGKSLWLDTFLQDSTIQLSSFFLQLFGQDVHWDGGIVLGIKGFAVRIGFPCAGLSGIAFASSAMTGYIFWRRAQLNVSRAISVIPLIAALSWGLNALRIAILLLIGAYWSPDLAVQGFHSYAGWISFTLLTGFLVVAVDRIAFFQATPVSGTATKAVPVLKDPVSAQILPFAVFLFSSLVVGASFEVSAIGYPVRVIAGLAALVLFIRCLPTGFSWTIDPHALVAGVAIAALWIWGHRDEEASLRQTVPGLSGFAVGVWVFFRLVGTAFLVPIVEELFFRAYLLKRLHFGGPNGISVAVLCSSTLFATLHSDFVLAFFSGVLFGVLALRRGRVWDAVVAHSIANALIGGKVLLTNNWALI
ncbi:MAG: exosortase E/protease, VPEID-CTERM system [Pseudomonadota bacterium]